MKEGLKPITVQTPPTLNPVSVNMDRSKFEDLIYKQGYDVYLEKAVVCGCNSKGADANLSTCKNCRGTGWVFINKTKTRAVIHSMNKETNFKEWSQEVPERSSITLRAADLPSYMDRLTVIDALEEVKQVLYPFELSTGEFVAYTYYSIVDIVHIMAFVGDTEKLVPLEEGEDYTIGTADICKGGIRDNFITFNEDYKDYDNFSVTIVYRHQPQFHIIELPRKVMVSRQAGGKDELMPVNAVGQAAHSVLDLENYLGDKYLDNTYDPANVVSQREDANLNKNVNFNL